MDKAKIIKENTQDLLDKMVDGAKIEVHEEEGMYRVDIQAEDEAPAVIGRHGETIRAIQKILEVIVYKATGERADLIINVNDYREKQVERLEYIADQAAAKVQERQSSTYLRGFSSYERRVMHEHVSKTYPDLKSYSLGEGRDRRLVIDLAGSESNVENDQKDDQSNIEVEEDDFKIEI